MKLILSALALCCLAMAAHARTLGEIKERGAIGLCAHPNSLPFASKTADPPGFQIELGRALARELGVSLTPDWILTAVQISRADCDIMLDAIGAHEVDAAAVTATSAGYYNKHHPGHEVVVLPPDDAAPALSWNVAVGMRRPDTALKEAIDAALLRLTNDGTITAIYARYGVTLPPPKP